MSYINVINRYYPDGYHVRDISCLDLIIAHAVGIFNSSNYYDYCMYRSCEILWGNNNLLEIFDYTYAPLKYLGYALHPLSKLSNNLTFDKEIFLSEISKLLLQGYPIVLLTNYYTLYYSEAYLKEPGNHLLLITGYDNERDIVTIQDAEVIGRGDTAPQYTSGQIFFKTNLKSSMLYDIILDYFKYIEKPITHAWNYIYSVIPCADYNKVNIKETVLNYITNSFNLFSYICNSDQIGKLSTKDYFSTLRRDFLGSSRIFCKYVEKNFINKEIFTEFIQVEKDFLESVNIYLSVFQKNYILHRDLNMVLYKERITNYLNTLLNYIIE